MREGEEAMTARIVNETEMPPALDARIREGLVACFPADAAVFCATRAWHGSAPAWSVVLEEPESGTVTAHCGIVARTVSAGAASLHVAGIQNVFVLPSQRGRGLCDIVMRAAMDEAAARGYDCGLLFCVPELEKVYARCGWLLLPPEPVIRIDEVGNELPIPGKNIAMWHPLRAQSFPPGPIHLRGNDW
jgi:GNAT superfamily N-acetyltransferase